MKQISPTGSADARFSHCEIDSVLAGDQRRAPAGGAIFMIVLINKRGLMQEWVNSKKYNVVAWTTVGVMFGITLALVGTSIRGL